MTNTYTATPIVLGFAGGAIVGTVAFEMVPRALELAPPALAIGAFAAGYLLMYAWARNATTSSRPRSRGAPAWC